MASPLPASLCLVATLLLTGCFDTKEDFTINPDGSGKVVHESVFPQADLSGGKDPAEEVLRKAIAQVIEQSKGVEAWCNVSFQRMDDGRLFFKGTAYFKDLSQLKIPQQTMLNFVWKKEGGGRAVLVLREKDEDSDNFPGKEPVDWSQLSPEERRKKNPGSAEPVSAVEAYVLLHVWSHETGGDVATARQAWPCH